MQSTQIEKETIPSSWIKNGTLATGAASAHIAPNLFNLRFGAVITAPAANTAPVFIGDADVTTGNGFPLAAGATLILPIMELKDIYAVSAAAQTLNWLGY